MLNGLGDVQVGLSMVGLMGDCALGGFQVEGVVVLSYGCLLTHLKVSSIISREDLVGKVPSIYSFIERQVPQTLLELFYLVKLVLALEDMVSIDELIKGKHIAHWSLHMVCLYVHGSLPHFKGIF